jgi:uncharacterized membrane protein YjfL (UPF0719 family)
MLKRTDFYFISILLVLFLPFLLSEQLFNSYKEFNHLHGLITSFVKFALLATLGETLGARIRTGHYLQKNFGIIPRMVVWGFIGITVKMSFIIFSVGTPAFLEYVGFQNASDAFRGNMGWAKLFVAFCTSVALNIIYAPIMMTFHKITDTHIHTYKGSLKALVSPIDFKKIFVNLNWSVQWNFVFKKTIPLFWIPAHTITFLLNPDYQVLFAAFLSIVLGAILAVADLMDNPSAEKQIDLKNS